MALGGCARPARCSRHVRGAPQQARNALQQLKRPTPAIAASALIAFAPVVVDPSGHHKFIALRFAVIAVGVVVGVVALAVRTERFVAPVRLTLGWVALLAAAALATAVAPDPLYSAIGDTTRMMGFAGLFVVFGSFVVGVTAATRRGAAMVSLFAAAAVVVAIGLAQMLGVVAHTGRVTSTMGNAGFLGAYLCVIVTLLAGRAIADRASRLWSLPLLTGAFVVLIGSGTRGAWIGTAAGLAVVGATRSALRPAFVAAGIGAVVVVAMLAPVGQHGDANSPGTAQGRLDTWRVSLGAIKQRPVLGWGPEGLRDGFAQQMDERYVRAYGLEQLPDRAHNRFLDVAATGGILGLGADAALLIGTGFTLRRRFLDATNDADRYFVLGVAGALVAWIVQGQFLFDTFDVAALLWLLVGLAVASGEGASLLRRPRPASAAVAALAAAVAVLGSLNLVADRHLQAASGRAPADAYQRLASVAHLRPRSLDAFTLAALVARSSRDPGLMRNAHALLQGWNDDEVIFADARLLNVLGATTGDRSALATALDELTRLSRRRPNDARLWSTRAEVLTRLGRESEATEARGRARALLPT